MIDNGNKEYLAAAKDWESDSVLRARRSERRAWWVAIAGALVGLAGVVAAASMAPLKTVEPFVVRVDNNTGLTDVVTLLDERTMTRDEAVDKYFLGQYVESREEYSEAIAFANYNRVGLMSSAEVGRRYGEAFKPENPKSPLNVYGRDGKVEVEVNSISFPDTGVAAIRFTRRDRVRQTESESRWLATITYEYLNPPTAEAERLVNPLGFQVSDYRIDAESIAVTPSPRRGD